MKNRFLQSICAAVLIVAVVDAQATSAIGTDNEPGNTFTPGGNNPVCYPDEDGLNPLARTPSRTPTGWLYDAPCRLFNKAPDKKSDDQSGWRTSIVVEAGGLYTSGDDDAYYLNEYTDFSNGVTISYLDISAENPETANYVDLYGGSLGRDDQYLSLEAGRHGKFEVNVRYNEIPHLTATGARTIFEGAGSGVLTLPAGIAPGTGSPESLLGLIASAPSTDLKVDRKRAGIGAEIRITPQMKLFANYDYEKREGGRPFGGAFFFAYAIPGFGSVNELIEPIDHGTHNFDLGTHLKGERWALNFAYIGSFFKNDTSTLTWDNPFFMPSLAPPPSGTYSPPQGRIDLWPDNEFHHLSADFSYRFGKTGSWVTTLSAGRMEQDDDLIPYTVNSGIGGTAPAPVDYDNWNSTGSLIRKSAQAEINTRLLQSKASFTPTRKLRLHAKVRLYQEDNDTEPFETYNPLTGEYGYIVTDGGLGSTVPFENHIYQPGFPSAPFHYKSIPFEYDKTTASIGADYRLGSTTLSGEYERIETDRKFREIPTTVDDRIRLIGVIRNWDKATLRLLGEYAEQRFDGNYTVNPYAPFYTSALPGYVSNLPGGVATAPHTLGSLVKHDIAERDESVLEARLNLLLSETIDGFVSVQYHDTDYASQHGLLDERAWTVNTEFSYMPGSDGSWYIFASWQQRDQSQANINDAGANLGSDPFPGSATYPLVNEWQADHEETAALVGLGHSRMIGRAKLALDYSFSDTSTEIGYWFASPGALTLPGYAAVAGTGMPAINYSRHILEANLAVPLRQDIDLRFYYRFEKGQIDDFHFDGLQEVTPGRNALYLGIDPGDWTSNTIGVFAQFRFD